MDAATIAQQLTATAHPTERDPSAPATDAQPAPVDNFTRLHAARQAIADQLKQLAKDVDKLGADAGFHALVRALVRFRGYSLANRFLIRWQRPDALEVRGAKQWAARGRPVKPGEKSIVIWAPRKNGERQFIVVEVYDIQQTEGPAVPEMPPPVAMTGDTEWLAPMERAARVLRIRLHELRLDPASGCYLAEGMACGRDVHVRPDLKGVERVRVLAHEYAHVLLHLGTRYRCKQREALSHATIEAEADATAYVVLSSLGLPCDTPHYVLFNGGSSMILYRSLKRIHMAATIILDALDGKKPKGRKVPDLPRNLERLGAGRQALAQARLAAKIAEAKARRRAEAAKGPSKESLPTSPSPPPRRTKKASRLRF